MRLEGGRLGIVAKSELQYGHARKPEFMTQRFDFRSDDAEILRDDGQIAEFPAEHCKQFCARSLDPAAIDRGGFTGRHLPISFETAKVVDADEVIEIGRASCRERV